MGRRRHRAIIQGKTKTLNSPAKTPISQSRANKIKSKSSSGIPGKRIDAGYQTQEEDTAQTQDAPSEIRLESGHLIEASGEVTMGPKTSSLTKLNATWSKGQVNLRWDKPQFDSATYKLDGYVISSTNYNPSSTNPVKNMI
ncbi:MAG: hypothetical protein QG670_2317 [Thermoproteota archaeon]|nr:hypothetical protein [Thermoproteota archaeon]